MTFRPGPPPPAPPTKGDAAAAAPLTDGEWHRLHPLTTAPQGRHRAHRRARYVLNNLRDQLLEFVIPGAGPQDDGDPSATCGSTAPSGGAARIVAADRADRALSTCRGGCTSSRHGRDRRGAVGRALPHEPPGPARPDPGHQHLAADHPADRRHGEARDRPGRQRRERAARVPRGPGGGRPALPHPRRARLRAKDDDPAGERPSYGPLQDPRRGAVLARARPGRRARHPRREGAPWSPDRLDAAVPARRCSSCWRSPR